MKRFNLMITTLLLVQVVGCSSSSNGSTAPAPLACATNNTAAVNFSNQSVTNRTYDILIDGSRVTSLAPGATSGYYNIVAGVPHAIQFNVSNSSTAACSPAVATLAQCVSQNYYCRG